MDARKAGAIVFNVLSYACRILALLLCALTVLLCFSGVSTRLGIVSFVIELTQSLPDVIAGYGLIPTPFGGVFRFDFMLMSVVLFIVDYLCARLARSLR
ncbi:hypothetical protein [Collinsella provencensis]|uniref:hypothetical protein n=1 Tax=Collinsella provencensis TaxID=1937461 RepID=UPI000C847CC3|nr:hypothetical protein [Collinsella provencensis]